MVNETRLTTLGERLRLCRLKLHLSQEYVAQFTGIEKTALTQIELGTRDVEANELACFSTLYSISTHTLLCGGNTRVPAAGSDEAFDTLDSRDQDEIISLMHFRKQLKKQQ